MFKEKEKLSIINKILITMLVFIIVLTIVMIFLIQFNKKNIETNVKETQGMIANNTIYAVNGENMWDVSANGDGSVVATLSEDGTLTISGIGDMKGWKYNATTDWHNSEIKKKVKNVVIKNGVASIGSNAFRYCSSLTTIDIPEGVASIGEYVFYDCNSLTNIEIPSSVMSIGDGAFLICNNLKEINVDENNIKYMDYNGVLYTRDTKRLIQYPIGKEDKDYTVLEGVTDIGYASFYKCSNLINITIPNGLMTIGDSAFEQCSSLRRVNIPEGVTSIGEDVFRTCDSLIDINIPLSIESIGRNAFYDCEITKWINRGDEIELLNILKRTQNEEDVLYTSNGFSLTNCTIDGTKVVIDENKTYAKVVVSGGLLGGLTYVISYSEWDISKDGDGSVIATLTDDGTLNIFGTGNMKDWDLDNWDIPNWYETSFSNKIKQVNISNGVTNIGRYAFVYCRNLIDIKIPNSVKSIGSYAFEECNSLISIEIPEGVTKIEDVTFRYCTNLVEIKIPEGVTTIGTSAFEECKSLTSIEIPSTVTSIGYDVFSGCSGLISVNIPKGVRRIGSRTFEDCSSLREIKVHEDNPNFMDEDGILYTKNKNEIIRYPEGKEEIKYAMSEKTTSISDSTFYGCSSLISIDIPEGVTSIGESAFYGCSSLKSINIPEEVSRISNNAFSGCSSLTNIEIPEKVTSIGQNAFYKCSNLVSINIPEGVISIKGYAFRECISLVDIKISKSVSRIETNTFEGCKSLISINIPEGVTSIGNSAFSGCSNLTSIKIPEGVTNIGNSAFWKCNNLTIICNSNSTAETYAKENEITYQIDDNAPTVDFEQNGTVSPVKAIETKITVEDELAGLVEESLKYIWSKQSENITKDQIVNNFENGGTLNIKDVTGIYYLWIYAKDNLGNESIVRSEAFVLDNIAPTAQVSYNISEETEHNVQVTIVANEEIQEVEGWTLSTDKKVLTQEYFENTEEIVKIKDIAGNESEVKIKVTQIKELFKNGTYEIKDRYITKVQPKTTYENFVKNIETSSQWKVTEDAQEVTGKTLIKTGQKLIVGDQIFTLVVTGDTNGDGQADLKDILGINKHRLNKSQLINEYLQAAEINGDEKVDLRDILQINKYRLGKISQL